MPKIAILNKRKITSGPWPGVSRIYVGRPSPLGNPFAIGVHGDRDQVVSLYREWLEKNKNRPEVQRELTKLLDILKSKEYLELVCWCSPAACHADVIKEHLLSLYNEDQETTSGLSV